MLPLNTQRTAKWRHRSTHRWVLRSSSRNDWCCGLTSLELITHQRKKINPPQGKQATEGTEVRGSQAGEPHGSTGQSPEVDLAPTGKPSFLSPSSSSESSTFHRVLRSETCWGNQAQMPEGMRWGHTTVLAVQFNPCELHLRSFSLGNACLQWHYWTLRLLGISWYSAVGIHWASSQCYRSHMVCFHSESHWDFISSGSFRKL